LRKPLPEFVAETTREKRRRGKRADVAQQRETLIRRRIAAATVLSRIETGSFTTAAQYWSLPYGEPEWVTIPAGEFWMGSGPEGREAFDNERPVHRLFVPEFRIARTSVTNAQYQLYIQATGAEPPPYWEDGQPPKDKLTHPVVGVSWHDACAYCAWLSTVTEKPIRLPTEAEWEKAARGDRDKRIYPWGDNFDLAKCNSCELGLDDTSPVGIFLAGASLYGCLDMSGNVWEWVHDWYDENYYQWGPDRDLKGPSSGESKVLRGGSWGNVPRYVRVSRRVRYAPGYRNGDFGFRCAR
jgi:formylglycine-generating enzyme required for sulfatase activity